MPLSIDLLGKNRFSIAHNFEQNGDLMADPDMEFVFDTEAGTLSARTYQQDNMSLYQSVEGGKGEVVNQGLAKQLDSFARQWFANIKAQDYQKERMTVEHRGEEIEIVYDESGAVKYLNGWTEATEDYARKNNIVLPPTASEAEAPQIESATTTPSGSDNEPNGVFVLPEAPERPKVERAQLSIFDIEPIPQPEPVSEQTIEPVSTDIDSTEADEFDDDDTAPVAVAIDAPPAPVPVEIPKPPNFRITADVDVGGGGAKTKYRRNAEAISVLKTIEAEERYATPDEQRVLALYSGWGGISQVFKDGHNDWRNEYAELKSLLTEKEYREAAGSTLNAHYTSPEVIEGIYAGLAKHV